MDQPTVTAANVLSGQKTTRTVHFAITGDLELDLAAGIIGVINLHGSLTHTQAHRILTMLVDRFAAGRRAEEEFERQRIQGDLQSKERGQISPHPTNPSPYSPWEPWNTTVQSVVAYEELQPPLNP